jgi:uncharacterized repeat protein (TIGR03806 family)
MPRLLLFFIFGLLCGTSPAEIVHRWSFNSIDGPIERHTTYLDSIRGAPAILRGNGATISGNALVLPGQTDGIPVPEGIAAYLDLPNGVVSSKQNLTVEVWVTPLSGSYTLRIFDFGRSEFAGDGLGAPGEITGLDGSGTSPIVPGTNYLCLISQVGTNLNHPWCAMVHPSAAVNLSAIRPSSYGTMYHYVVTFKGGGGAYGENGGILTWYRNGEVLGSADVPFRLQDIEDCNNWFGRSQYTLEPIAHSSFNEIRIYDHAFTAAEVTASFQAGPDAAISAPPPVAHADSLIMHHSQKARIHVVANDAGNLDPESVSIVNGPVHGTATLSGTGSFLYTHTTGSPLADQFTYRIWNYPRTASAEATVTIQFSSSLRIPTTGLNVPPTPPPALFQLQPAFPGVSFNAGSVLSSPAGDLERLFVAELTGRVHLIPDVQAPNPSKLTFLDLPAVLASRQPAENVASFAETGLLGLVFHPNHATNGYFYLYYTAGTANGYIQRLSRFSVQPGNPNAADPDSELVYLELTLLSGGHNGGDLHFGPDGYLYISVGDNGVANDNFEVSQRIDGQLVSGILRIDVDQKPGNLPPNPHPAIILDAGQARYSIPADNPFVGATAFNGQPVAPGQVRTELWAVGLRNPWRFSFDFATGELWCGDVGQGAVEEINLINRGGNYGWSFFEGTFPGFPGSRTIPEDFTSIPPLYEYLHTHWSGDSQFKGNSVTGGIVYRGTRIPSLAGKYIFADFSAGSVWALERNSGAVNVERLTGITGVIAIGRDPSNQDVLFSNYFDGQIYRLTLGDSTVTTFPSTLSMTGLFADLSDLSPSPGVLPYSVNLPFWSDFADKRRWFAMPNAPSQLAWFKDQSWTAPTGTIWVKHFDLEMTRGNPSTKKRIETRMLVRNEEGVYGVSYRWNDAQTEATLVGDNGEDIPLTIIEEGVPRSQVWNIPSRSDCKACHNQTAGYALSFNTRQMNLQGTIHGYTGNQIQLLKNNGFFNNVPESPNVLPRHVRPNEESYSLEARARAYLAVNCDFCHRPGGTAPTQWDVRAHSTLAQTGLILGGVTNHGGDPANKLIVPGSAANSVVWNRMALANGFTRMPPIGSNELDQTAIALLNAWITESLPNRVSYAQWRYEWFDSSNSPSGEPEADPEADGYTNQEEFLRGTNPLLHTASFTGLQLTYTPQTVTISGEVPPDRTAQIETSLDMVNWRPWDVPNNDTLFTSGGTLILTGAMDDPVRFFRLRLSEN